jgi:hypothetical protein
MSILYMREEKSNSLAVAGKQAETCCTVSEPDLQDHAVQCRGELECYFFL